jgi:hypothetical protein
MFPAFKLPMVETTEEEFNSLAKAAFDPTPYLIKPLHPETQFRNAVKSFRKHKPIDPKKHASGDLLTDDQVRYIRRSGYKTGFLSKMFKMNPKTIYNIRERKSYLWVL